VIAEHTAWWWIRRISQILWFITLAVVFWSGIKPFGKFSTKWHDRAIRAGGAGIILALALIGLALYLRG
jgi:hypothetical protein